MEERIKINGVWYVREKEVNIEPLIRQADLTYVKEVIFENGIVMLTLTVLTSPEGNVEGDPWLTITDKTVGKKHEWHNIRFLRGLVEGDKEVIDQARLDLTKEVLDFVITFLKTINEDFLK